MTKADILKVKVLSQASRLPLNGLTLYSARTGPSLEPSDLFLELIDSFLERAQRKFSYVVAGSRSLLRVNVELLQLLEFQSRVFKLTPILDAHGTTSTIPFGTRLRIPMVRIRDNRFVSLDELPERERGAQERADALSGELNSVRCPRAKVPSSPVIRTGPGRKAAASINASSRRP
jgi:hypothetical protein